MEMPDPTFPPLLNGHAADGPEPVFDLACAGAARGDLGAGDVVWSRDEAQVEAAIVLEPEVGMDVAVQMLPVCMAALGDCLGALTPPQVGVTFIWPNLLCVNGAPAGTFRAAAAAAEEGAAPAWLVIGLSLRHQRKPSDPEPGTTPDITWLAEEGGAELTRSQIIESYCRHFLTWLNIWNDDGFKPVHDSWLYRAEQRDQEVRLSHAGEEVSGTFVGLDDSGNLLMKDKDGATRALYLADCFERPGAKAAS